MKCNYKDHSWRSLVWNLRMKIVESNETIMACFYKDLGKKHNLEEFVNNENKEEIGKLFDEWYKKLEEYNKYIYKLDMSGQDANNEVGEDND